jgi:ABC-type transport system substrate-binding protein
MMKSKKWLISLGLAVVLVVAFALPACETTPTENWYTPEGEKISFEITATSGTYNNIALMVAEDLQDLGLDVTVRVLDSTTYYEYLYEPNLGGMEAFVSAEDPSPDPWSDWIWMMLSDPEDYGYLWNPCWYYDERYDELMVNNYVAPNLSAKQEILLELQEILAEDLPIIFLVREDLISVYREDKWTNWFNELGGPVTWINEHSIREVTQAGDATQLNIGTLTLMSNLLMDQDSLQYTNAGCLYLMLVYETPVFFPKVDEASMEANPDAAYDFVPKLATDYEVTYESDGEGGQNQVWTIDVRDDVKWHDGENFTADDWEYTLKYAMSRWSANRPVNWTAAEANDWEILPEHMLIEATSDYQVQLRYIDGYHQNEDFLPCSWLWYAIVPEHVFGPAGNGTYEGWNEDPLAWDGDMIGTGPYKVKEFAVDEYLLLERNDDYWGPLPEAEQVLFKLYSDYGAMWLALESGEIDTTMGSGAPFAKYDAYVANEDLTVEVEPDLSINYLGFNLHPTGGYEPLQDLALRQAIAAAIDKENIVDIAFGGYAEVADSWTYNESPNHHPDLPNNEYDPTEAASILTAAGYTFHE